MLCRSGGRRDEQQAKEGPALFHPRLAAVRQQAKRGSGERKDASTSWSHLFFVKSLIRPKSRFFLNSRARAGHGAARPWKQGTVQTGLGGTDGSCLRPGSRSGSPGLDPYPVVPSFDSTGLCVTEGTRPGSVVAGNGSHAQGTEGARRLPPERACCLEPISGLRAQPRRPLCTRVASRGLPGSNCPVRPAWSPCSRRLADT